MSDAIPLAWIKAHVDTLIKVAASYPDGKMQEAIALRADHIMDMVKAWKESKKGTHE